MLVRLIKERGEARRERGEGRRLLLQLIDYCKQLPRRGEVYVTGSDSACAVAKLFPGARQRPERKKNWERSGGRLRDGLQFIIAIGSVGILIYASSPVDIRCSSRLSLLLP